MDQRPDYLSYVPALRRYFSRRVSNGAMVDDLVQDVMLRMHARDAKDSIDNLEGYIFRTATSVLRDQARRDKARHAASHGELTEKDHPAEECTADRVLEGKEELARLVHALEDLPERTRDIFLMRRYEGWAYGEIAEKVGISVSAIEKHVAKAVAHIARRLVR
ncbi:RNA polymerase sigma factor [Sphingobium sp. BYY-5]|uniref:RNA polymerase sigma factor n=1 Tax=Sphingobium sp. BYY-5 TaxID=2926400 RepID=UPI001FA801E1|nr:RNA polymerase sigma factor [Sphingobium sp. BYY-5]MCI4592146.1 RNA polymerase sigma factor [Sphingobium sp. BYY-5]